MSNICVEFLMKNYEKKPILPPSHRWVYTFYALERLLLLRDGITDLANTHEKVEECQLTLLQWRQATSLKNLLKPLADFERVLEGENYITISKVLPALLDIEAFLDEENIGGFVGLTRSLKADIRKRFRSVLDPGSPEFQPIYVTATLLDQKFTKSLDLPEYHALKTAAIKHLKQLANALQLDRNLDLDAQHGQVDNLHQQQHGGELFSRLFSRVEQLQAQVRNSHARPSDLEVDQFLHFRDTWAQQEPRLLNSPIEFWLMKAGTFPILHKVAIDILCVPATSAASERVFSQAGLCASALRSRLSNDNLESEVMIRVNRALL